MTKKEIINQLKEILEKDGEWEMGETELEGYYNERIQDLIDKLQKEVKDDTTNP